MKLTSIGTVGRLGGPFEFTFNIPQDQLPPGGQRTIAGPYDRYRTNPTYQNGMLGSVQSGASNPSGRVINAETDTFFGDFDFLDIESAVEPTDYVTLRDTTSTGSVVETSVTKKTFDFLKDFAEDTGVSDAVKQSVNLALKAGINELKEFLSPQDVGRKVINPANGKKGVVSADPNNPGKFIIRYDDGTSEAYNNQQVLIQGNPPKSDNNMLLIVGVLVAAAFLLK